ncbi:MAG: hypothetical protein Q9170_007351, partial [Blastenia crenularia]
MSQTTPLDFQIRLDFIFAYDKETVLRHAYGHDGLSPWQQPQKDRVDYACLEHLALLLSGYDIAAEAWAAGVHSRDVRISTQNPDARLPYWSIHSGDARPGSEQYAFEHGTETPFETITTAYICPIQLVSPPFNETDAEWTHFSTTLNRILPRLQTPRNLHRASSSPSRPRIKHLAWTNESCKLTVTVRAVNDEDQLSWPTLQNLQAAWGSSANEIARMIQPINTSAARMAYSKPITQNQGEEESLANLYSVPSLLKYLSLESYTLAQAAVRKMSLLTNTEGDQCYGLRFEEHR